MPSSKSWTFADHFIAGADLSTYRHCVMVMTDANKVGLATAPASLFNIGILENDPKSGRMATVTLLGRTKAIAGAAVAAPKLLATNASGRVIAATSGDTVIGLAKTDAAADGDFIEILMGAVFASDNLS